MEFKGLNTKPSFSGSTAIHRGRCLVFLSGMVGTPRLEGEEKFWIVAKRPVIPAQAGIQ